MTMNVLIAPDFAPEHFAGWHMLNTHLQKKTGLKLHLMTPGSPKEQNELIAAGKVDLIYANPFDSAAMVRESGFRAVARPKGKSNEMVIATGADSPVDAVEGLKPGSRIALTDNKDVKLIGLRLLEPADLAESDLQFVPVENYQAAARQAIKGEVDASFFLAEAFHSLSRLSKSQMKVLIESNLADISHVLLVSPKAAEHAEGIVNALVGMTGAADGQTILDELGLSKGFEAIEEEDMEFMIDLMETLLD